VDTIEEARQAAERLGDRYFLAIGRQPLGEFAGLTDRQVLVRVLDAPDFTVPDSWTVLRARGPFTLADELDLLHNHGIDVLVAKDSGGSTEAKLDAAAKLGVAVVMVRRPALPVDVPVVTTAAEAAAWLRPAP
jgi:precorrin-6A/cobalt-precorrin-6A reductase